MNMPPLPSDANPDDESLAAALRATRMLVDAPEPLVRRALDLGCPASPVRQPAPGSTWRQLVATLRFDSASLGLLASGRRGAATRGHLASRQLLYSVDGRDIDLRLAPLDGGTRWVLSGQVLGPELAGRAELHEEATGGPAGSAAVASAPAQRQTVAWNEWAEFEFEPLHAGPCRLRLSTSDWTVVLSLDIGGPPGGVVPAVLAQGWHV